jgi:hypothetical protein
MEYQLLKRQTAWKAYEYATWNIHLIWSINFSNVSILLNILYEQKNHFKNVLYEPTKALALPLNALCEPTYYAHPKKSHWLSCLLNVLYESTLALAFFDVSICMYMCIWLQIIYTYMNICHIHICLYITYIYVISDMRSSSAIAHFGELISDMRYSSAIAHYLYLIWDSVALSLAVARSVARAVALALTLENCRNVVMSLI